MILMILTVDVVPCVPILKKPISSEPISLELTWSKHICHMQTCMKLTSLAHILATQISVMPISKVQNSGMSAFAMLNSTLQISADQISTKQNLFGPTSTELISGGPDYSGLPS